MKITFTAGATSTKVGDKKPTRFYGGETEDIVDKEAKYLITNSFAAKPGSAAAKAFLGTMDENPRTRRQDLNARTPGLDAVIAAKQVGKARAARSRTAILGQELNGGAGDPDGDNQAE